MPNVCPSLRNYCLPSELVSLPPCFFPAKERGKAPRGQEREYPTLGDHVRAAIPRQIVQDFTWWLREP